MAGERKGEVPERLAFEQRVHNVRLSVWENADKNGRIFHNVKITRRYESAPGEWSDSNTFTGLGDLAALREATELALDWLRGVAINAFEQRKAA